MPPLNSNHFPTPMQIVRRCAPKYRSIDAMQDQCINLQLATAFYALKHSRRISRRALRDQIMFVYLVTHKTFLLRPLSTSPLPDESRFASKRNVRHAKLRSTLSNTNEEEAGRTRFRLIETRENYHGHPWSRRSRPSHTAVRVGECRFEAQ